MVTSAPACAADGKTAVNDGGGTSVNGRPLLDCSETVTTTLPLVAPDGTGTWMLFVLQLLGVAWTPLNITVLVDCVAMKLLPAIVTVSFRWAAEGDSDVSAGGPNTVKDAPLLVTL